MAMSAGRLNKGVLPMAPQCTVVDHRAPESELGKPLSATSCAPDRKICRSRKALFTQSVRSATINHNNLDTCELPALILGAQRDGFETEFLLRARRGSEAGRRRGTGCLSRAPRGPQSIHHAARVLFRAAPSHHPT